MSYWMIRRVTDHGQLYLRDRVADDGQISEGWTADATGARRFGSKFDAESEVALLDATCAAVEYDAPPKKKPVAEPPPAPEPVAEAVPVKPKTGFFKKK